MQPRGELEHETLGAAWIETEDDLQNARRVHG
jgi:hypothetical protein